MDLSKVPLNKIQINEGGRQLLKSAKAHIAKRKENSRKDIEASMHDASGYLRAVDRARVFTTVGDGISQKRWDRIFGKKKRSTRNGTAHRGTR